jgi:hypothetical protein
MSDARGSQRLWSPCSFPENAPEARMVGAWAVRVSATLGIA